MSDDAERFANVVLSRFVDERTKEADQSHAAFVRDAMVWGCIITQDGNRIDPAEFFAHRKPPTD